MLSIIVTLIVIFAMVLGMLFGFLRGFKNSIIRLPSVVLAALLSFGIALLISRLFVGKGLLVTVLSIFNVEDTYNELASVSGSFVEIIKGILVAIITPIVFLVLFYLFKYLLLIPYVIIKKRINPENNKKNIKERLLGIPLGAVQGLISVFVLLFVVGGYFCLADKVVTAANDISNQETASGMQDVVDIADEIKADPVMGLLCSGESNNFVFEGLSRFKFQGEKCSLTNEVVTISETLLELTPLMNSDNNSSISNKEIAVLEGFTEKFGESVILKAIGAEMIAGGCEKWSEDEAFMGISFMGTDTSIYPIVIATFNVMEETTPKTIESDMNVFINMFKVCDKYGILNQSGDNTDKLIETLNSGFTAELIDVLSQNERFSPIVSEIKTLSINMLATALKVPEVSEEEYDQVSEEIASALNEARQYDDQEEAKQWLSEEMHNAISSNGIEIDESVSELISEAINEAFAEHFDEITKETIQEYLDKYSIEYQN